MPLLITRRVHSIALYIPVYTEVLVQVRVRYICTVSLTALLHSCTASQYCNTEYVPNTVCSKYPVYVYQEIYHPCTYRYTYRYRYAELYEWDSQYSGLRTFRRKLVVQVRVGIYTLPVDEFLSNDGFPMKGKAMTLKISMYTNMKAKIVLITVVACMFLFTATGVNALANQNLHRTNIRGGQQAIMSAPGGSNKDAEATVDAKDEEKGERDAAAEALQSAFNNWDGAKDAPKPPAPKFTEKKAAVEKKPPPPPKKATPPKKQPIDLSGMTTVPIVSENEVKEIANDIRSEIKGDIRRFVS